MIKTTPSDLIAAIQALYVRLQVSEPSTPWPELEQICHQTPEDLAPAVLRDPRIQAIRPALQALRAAYEYELEKAAALRILQQPEPAAGFGAFGMYERYVRVVDLEMTLIRQFQAASPLKVLFIGSGPLPVTALLLAEK